MSLQYSKSLKTVFLATITRYNLGQPCMDLSKEFENNPTEEELLIFLNKSNENDRYKDFYTTISVEKIYRVINNM